eukprot:TRINITY_DN103340_c0_g1_i1.p2 TRINITY_DN103340_c0_g1~~TRINITY_DN103340_c0_g1_i1.p2  ORF type:complete len:248 (+),score=21.97 TRINITY_DN103340_c0_g1_i1:29-772(+)
MKLLLLLIGCVCVTADLGLLATEGCYKNSTVRGVGKPISACPPGWQKNGLLCYPDCKAGYKGVGPVCWEICPKGFTDTGAFCQPDSKWGDNSHCGTWDKCGVTFDKGCVKCPTGWETHGCICKYPGHIFAKKSYGRGVGKPMDCKNGTINDAGLCYPPCHHGFKGNGPVCWESCPAGQGFACGAICLKDAKQCAQKVKTLADALLELGFNLAECVLDSAGCNLKEIKGEIKHIIDELAIPICSVHWN